MAGFDPTVAAYQAGSVLARSAPDGLTRRAARVLGMAASRVSAERRLIVERNLARVSPGLTGIGLRRAVLDTFDSYARYWAESLRLPSLSPQEVDAGISVVGYDRIAAAITDGRGAILALPHLGGWEWAGFWLATVRDIETTVVVEAVEPPELFEWFAEYRRSLGMHIVPLGPEAGSAVVRAVKANHVVGLLCDRDIGGGGVEVEFFGERTTLPGGPATLALRTGAALLPGAVYFEGDRRRGVVRPEIIVERQGRLREDVQRLTQVLAGELEQLIRAAPEQWHLMQPNWPSDHEALRRYRRSRGR